MHSSWFSLKRRRPLATLLSGLCFVCLSLAANPTEAHAVAAATSTATTKGSDIATASVSSKTEDFTSGTVEATTFTQSASGQVSSGASVATLTAGSISIPTYPAPSVPPTSNAPFMKHSHLPDGTVFIAVGSILGAFGVAVLLWRAAMAYFLHRNIARVAKAQHAANDKASFATPLAPYSKYSDHDSSFHGGAAAAATLPGHRGVRRTQRGPIPSSTPSQTNLFFSPTAAPGGTNGLGGAALGNRDSRLLPAGYYAAGSSSAISPGEAPSISLSSTHPDSLSQERERGAGPRHSPPDSPAFGPHSTPMLGPRDMSGSSLSLHQPPSGRAPSVFLNELLDEQPDMFPDDSPSHQRPSGYSK